MSWLRGVGAVLLGLAVVLAGLVAYELRTSAPLAVLVRNTPQLGWVDWLLPAPPAIIQSVAATAGDPRLTGVLYQPQGQRASSGVLLVNGAEVPGGWQNADIVTFSRSIADLGQVVYVPDLPGGLEQGTATVQTLDALEADAAWFSSQMASAPVTMVGVCVGASLALASAEDQPEVIRAVIGLDPYADVADLLEAATTGTGPGLDGRPRQFEMVGWVQADVARSVAALVSDQVSRDKLMQLISTAPGDQPLALFGATPPPETLSQAGRALWLIYANRDPARFADLYNALPAEMRRQLQQLSPQSAMATLRAKVLLAAPFNDFAFPAGEATKLEKAKPNLVRVTRSAALDHVSPDFGPGVVEGYWHLWRFASAAVALMR